jgi:hypothetical protein
MKKAIIFALFVATGYTAQAQSAKPKVPAQPVAKPLPAKAKTPSQPVAQPLPAQPPAAPQPPKATNQTGQHLQLGKKQ